MQARTSGAGEMIWYQKDNIINHSQPLAGDRSSALNLAAAPVTLS
jgi:hypothetical protein